MSHIKYTVVVPAFSEATVLESSLIKLEQALVQSRLHKHTEVVIVVANSPDDTAKIATDNKHRFAYFNLIEPGNKLGKGRDVRAGVLSARGDYVLFTDADMATPPSHISSAFEVLESGKAEVVIGVRPLSKIHKSLSRRMRSVFSNMLIRLLAVPGISDTQCGFKGFSKEACVRLFEPLETMKWGFDIEILVRAHSNKYKIKTILIDDWDDPKIGSMQLVGESDLQANLRTLGELFVIAYKRLTGYYK